MASNHFEIQPPSAWDNTSITVTVNQGSLPNESSAYLYVVDANGAYNTNGYPITFAGIDGCTPVWGCANWSVCTDSIQTRSCSDSNHCDSDAGRPVETAGCDSTVPGVVTDLVAS